MSFYRKSLKRRSREIRVLTFPIALKSPRQQRCRDACQIAERYDHYNIQSRGFETSRDLSIRRLTARERLRVLSRSCRLMLYWNDPRVMLISMKRCIPVLLRLLDNVRMCVWKTPLVFTATFHNGFPWGIQRTRVFMGHIRQARPIHNEKVAFYFLSWHAPGSITMTS